MTPQKRLSLIYQAASSMESDLIIKPVDLQKLLNFAECVKLMAVQAEFRPLKTRPHSAPTGAAFGFCYAPPLARDSESTND